MENAPGCVGIDEYRARADKRCKMFMENPSEREYYDDAPSDECREFIKHEWIYDIYDGFPIDAYNEEREGIADRMSVADLVYVMSNTPVSPYRMYLEKKAYAAAEREGVVLSDKWPHRPVVV